ncbi:MAG: EAL domain-containing protein [Rhodospirillaceae bacterium]|nr:EAL domain-containing protein [Rhodospirillaceae bacterium]
MNQVAFNTPRNQGPGFLPSIMGSVRRRWADVANDLDIAFQPIIDIHTGRAFGFEALMRGFNRHQFDSPIDLINRCWEDGYLDILEERIIERSFAHFTTLPEWRSLKLFVNLDGRTIVSQGGVSQGGASQGSLRAALMALKSRYGISNANLALEISERYDFAANPVGLERLLELRRAFGALTMDDFGAGHANLQLFYHLEPGILKLDRFLISSIGTDPKKTVFLKHIVMMAHLLGALVIAEGIETAQEFYVCRELGCDLAQGFMIARPTTDLSKLRTSYPDIVTLRENDRRRFDTDADMVSAQLERIVPLFVDQDLEVLFSRFSNEGDHAFFPVIDQVGHPLGIVHERDLKHFAYSKYGRELMRNPRRTFNLARFIRPCAYASLNASTEKILEIFSAHPGGEGVLILEESKYAGFLHAAALLQILNEKNIKLARDQNPLSKLPGNILIHEYVSTAILNTADSYHFAYLDFDNFKPFNDTYGFRIGDRAIQMFAEILRSEFSREACFIGHVGGDDFFVGFRNCAPAAVMSELKAVCDKFGRDIESLYSEDDRRNGYITGQTRSGRRKRFPLLAISGVAVWKQKGVKLSNIDALSLLIADGKKQAKRSAAKLIEMQT